MEIEKKSSKRNRKKLSKYKKEEELMAKEQKDLEEDIDNVDTKDGYERLILRNPNSSYLWIRYVAFVLEKEDMKHARK
jgi:rRNA biogenesis protein RRP5